VAGYYDHLLAFLEHAVDHAYLKPAHLNLLQTAAQPADLLAILKAYQAPEETKWLERKDL